MNTSLMKVCRVLLVTAVIPGAAIVLGLSLAGCALGPSGGGLSAQLQLPADRVADVARTAGSFTFQTVLPVDVTLGVNLYQSSAKRSAASSGTETPVFVNLKDLAGEVLMSSMVNAGQQLNTCVYVPAGSGSVFLTLDAPGYDSRSVEIADPAGLSAINRTMALAASATPAPQDAVLDRDGDGVPNLYDAAPDDPQVAFIVQMKGLTTKTGANSSGCITLAFEDNYPTIGDGDFNDFVVQMNITEFFSGPKDGFRMTSLDANAFAISKNAGYDHSFGLAVHYPGLTANVEVVRNDADGVQLADETTLAVRDVASVTLFPSTQAATAPNKGAATFHGYTSRLHLSALSATDGAPVIGGSMDGNSGLNRMGIEAPPYDPYILVKQTGKDIHMIGKPALDGTGGANSFTNPGGTPWVLVVPSDWAHPTEATRIGTVYLDFDAWVASQGANHTNWYDPTTANVDTTKIVVEACPLAGMVGTN